MRPSNEWLDFIDGHLWSGTYSICFLYGLTVREYEAQLIQGSSKVALEIENKIQLLEGDRVSLNQSFPNKFKDGQYYYSPKDFIQWASHRNLPVPNEVREFIKPDEELRKGLKIALEGLELQPEHLNTDELAFYLKHRKWTALQAIFILHGKKPQGTDDNTRYELQRHFIQAYSYLEQDAMTADEGEPLKPKPIGGRVTTCCETPDFWFSWAQSKGLPIDRRLVEYFKLNAIKDIQAEATESIKLIKPSGTEPKAESPESNDSAKPIESEPKTVMVCSVFKEFENLRSNEVSFVVNDSDAKVVIRKKAITVSCQQLGLKFGSQGWKIFEGAAVSSGDLSASLKKLNKTSDLEKENTNIKTAVSRLRKSVKNSMGLIDDPIAYQENCGYKFTFKSMTHVLLHGDRVTKGVDAMDYIDDKNQNNSGFWDNDEI